MTWPLISDLPSESRFNVFGPPSVAHKLGALGQLRHRSVLCWSMSFLYQSAASLNLSGMAMPGQRPRMGGSGTDERRRCQCRHWEGLGNTMPEFEHSHRCTMFLSEVEESQGIKQS